jgi:hypothetical protein
LANRGPLHRKAFEIRAARQWLAIGVEGDWVITADRKPGVPVDNDAFGYAACKCGQGQAGKKAEEERESRDQRLLFPAELPCCGHSFGQPSADSQRPEKRNKQHLSGRL